MIPGGEVLNIKTTAYAIHARDSGPANPSVGLVNVTVVDNTNGVQSEAVPVTMDFVTIARNGFRGLRFLRDLGNLGSVQLRIWHSVIVEHTGNCNGLDGDALEYDVKGGRNASSDASCGFSGSADFENISYPFFGPLDNYGGRTPVLMPRPDSELIDTGGMLCTPSFEDQREVTRPLDGNVDAVSGCDLGAVEYDPLSDPTLAPEIFKDGFE